MKGICITISILFFVVLWTDVRAEGELRTKEEGTQIASLYKMDAVFYSTAKGIIDVPDPLLTLTPKLTEELNKSEQQLQARGVQLQNLVKSISAIEDREVGLTNKDKLEIADAALSAQEQTGVDAVLMVAVARMESDFRRITQVNARCKVGIQQLGCYADCGMTQHHIRGPAKYVNTYCAALAKNTKEAFRLSAMEIAHHVKWCQEHVHVARYRPLRQCVLNRYNMGPSYQTVGGCKQQYRCEARPIDPNSVDFGRFARAVAICRAQKRKCIMRSSYWERVTCFEYGARKLLRSTRSCRWCTGITQIPRIFYKAAQDPVLMGGLDGTKQIGAIGAPQ